MSLNLAIEDTRFSSKPLKIDSRLAKRYYRQLGDLKKSLGIKEHVSLGELVLLPEVITCRQLESGTEQIWPVVKAALDKALARLVESRESEGLALKKDLLARALTIERLVKQIKQHSPETVARYAKKLRDKIRQIAGSVKLDSGRLETEVAIFAKNCDIAEEVTRSLAHIENFRGTVLAGGEAGRRLDFIAQELFREANTAGAKAQDIRISRLVIQIKEEIEKIREQVQNVE